MIESEVVSLWHDREELAEFRRWLEGISENIDKKLYLNEIRWVDHYDGTNMEEWECTVCLERYLSSVKGICPVCHPFEEETL